MVIILFSFLLLLNIILLDIPIEPTNLQYFHFIKAASFKKVGAKIIYFFLLLIWTYGMIFEETIRHYLVAFKII